MPSGLTAVHVTDATQIASAAFYYTTNYGSTCHAPKLTTLTLRRMGLGDEHVTLLAALQRLTYLDIRDNRAVWFFGLPHGRSKTFTVGLRAAYSGSFVLPATVCQDMYHPSVTASTADGVAKVSR